MKFFDWAVEKFGANLVASVVTALFLLGAVVVAAVLSHVFDPAPAFVIRDGRSPRALEEKIQDLHERVSFLEGFTGANHARETFKR